MKYELKLQIKIWFNKIEKMYGEPNTNKMQRTAHNATQQFHRIHGKAKGSMMKRIWKRVIPSSPVIKGVVWSTGTNSKVQ